MVEMEEISEKNEKRLINACDLLLDTVREISRERTKELGTEGIAEGFLDEMVLVAIHVLLSRHWDRLERTNIIGALGEIRRFKEYPT